MKPQQYEQWLFDRERLTAAEETELQHAIAESEGLRELNASWRSLEPLLRDGQPIDPAPGFAQRWRVRAQEQRQLRRRRQVGLLLGGTLTGAFASLLLIAIATLNSPAGLASTWIGAVIRMRQTLEAAIHLLAAFGDGLPAIAGGVVLSLTLAWLSVVWFASLYRFAFQNLSNGGR